MFKLPQRPQPEGHKVYGSLAYAPYTLETYRNTEKLTKTKYQVTVANHQPLVLDLEMLASASEVYQISPDPKDYIVVPIPIVTVGVPNRNLQAFPLEEVTLFDHNQGQLVYQTFKNKPLFINHAHDVVPNSKGIHVDSSMEYIPKYGVWKICVVTMWDRTKDAALVHQMLKNESNAFSMGALSSAFLPVAAGSLVHTKRGLVPVEEVTNQDLLLTKSGWKPCDGVVYRGVQQVVTIETDIGSVLSLTPDHEVMTLTPDLELKYVRAADLKENDVLAFARNLHEELVAEEYPPFKATAEVDSNGRLTCQVCGSKFSQLQAHIKTHGYDAAGYVEEFGATVLDNNTRIADLSIPKTDIGYLLGALVADGSHTAVGTSSVMGTGRVTYSEPDPAGQERYKDILCRLFPGINVDFGRYRHGISAHISGSGLSGLLQYLGLGFQNGPKKRVPKYVLAGSREVKLAFLAGYWFGDGHKADGKNLSWTSVSPALLRDVQLVLSELGIASRMSLGSSSPGDMRPGKNVTITSRHQSYLLFVFGKDADKLVEGMTPFLPPKAKKVLNLLSTNQTRRNAQWADRVPFVMDHLKSLQKLKSETDKHGPSLRYVELRDTSHFNKGLLSLFPTLLENIRVYSPGLASKIEELVAMPVAWVKAERLSVVPEHKPVYCVKDVQDENHFFANGLLVHNCSVCGKMVFPDQFDKNCAHQQKHTAGTTFGKEKRLAYQLITGSCFFETSYIPVERGQFPADPTAYSPDVFS